MRWFVSVLLVFLFSATTFPQTDNGCGLKFTGKARKLVKMRLASKNSRLHCAPTQAQGSRSSSSEQHLENSPCEQLAKLPG